AAGTPQLALPEPGVAELGVGQPLVHLGELRVPLRRGQAAVECGAVDLAPPVREVALYVGVGHVVRKASIPENPAPLKWRMATEPSPLPVAPGLSGPVLRGLVTLDGVTVRDADAALAAETDAECASLRARFGEGKSAEVPGAADARTLYKALGIDPTKVRPSNEALLRRALK